MKDNHEYSTSVLHVCAKNLFVIALFVLLSKAFGRWWISLFALLFQTDIPRLISAIKIPSTAQYVACSFCGELLLVKDVQNVVHEEMEEKGWERLPCPHGWMNVCPHCQKEHAETIEQIVNSTEF